MATTQSDAVSPIVVNRETKTRSLRVGRMGNARYLPIGRILPFLSFKDKVLCEVTIYYDLDNRVTAWTASLTAVPKEPIVPIKKRSKKK